MGSEATSHRSSRWLIAAFGFTTLLGAFLLFEVQPLISKAILPWFGGVPAVWTTCMLFFQVLLLAGYIYAHLLQRWLSARNQATVHLAVVIVAAMVLPILPGVEWRPPDGSSPTWRILLLLAGTVGLPYFALAATSPLVQTWFRGSLPGRSPYRLYALSNLGSLVALLAYPLAIEPALDLPRQSSAWTVLFVLYAVACAAALVCVWAGRPSSPAEWHALKGRSGSPDVASRAPDHALSGRATPEVLSGRAMRPTWIDRLSWLALPALASLLLLAATNHICQDIAVVPLLWVVPLALYLLSFIVCFDHARWYVWPVWAALTALAMVGAVLCDAFHEAVLSNVGLVMLLGIYFLALFCACMVCHGELARRKPDPDHLTEFYLLIAAGGAIGGVLVAVVAPLLFSSYLEWQVGVAAAAVLSCGLLALRGVRRRDWLLRDLCFGGFGFVVVVGLGYAVLFPYWLSEPAAPQVVQGRIDRARNFFGIVSVNNDHLSEADTDRYRLLINGRIRHGCQFLDPARRRLPTSYYGKPSGVGRAIRYLQAAGPIRIGAIGLGAGTLAAYARPGDTLVFYEINPEVVRMARQYFTYLSDCRGDWKVVMGDARLSLLAELDPPPVAEAEPSGQRTIVTRSGSAGSGPGESSHPVAGGADGAPSAPAAPPKPFDLLVVDAFTGDAIPTHLLTREVLAIYRRRLTPKGVVAFHVSNTYLRLSPIVQRLADDGGMLATRINHVAPPNELNLVSSSTWMLLTRDEAFVRDLPSDPPDWARDGIDVPLWTDQYSNLFRILKSRHE